MKITDKFNYMKMKNTEQPKNLKKDKESERDRPCMVKILTPRFAKCVSIQQKGRETILDNS